MSANSALPDNPQRISLVCACGKKLVANSLQSGKRLKCRSCGQIVVVPPVGAGIVPTPTTAAPEPHGKAGNRGLMFVVWSLPVVLAIGGGASDSLRLETETTGARRRCPYRSEGGSQNGRGPAKRE